MKNNTELFFIYLNVKIFYYLKNVMKKNKIYFVIKMLIKGRKFFNN